MVSGTLSLRDYKGELLLKFLKLKQTSWLWHVGNRSFWSLNMENLGLYLAETKLFVLIKL